jgi:hypothetical protein
MILSISLLYCGEENIVPELRRNSESLLPVFIMMLHVIDLKIPPVTVLWLSMMKVIVDQIIDNKTYYESSTPCVK